MPKILVVEDERSLQKALTDALVKEGMEVVNALDGEIGLSLAKKEMPDLILLDLILPKIDGFEVLKQLKADATTVKIPVVVLTNLENSGDVERVLALGATNYLVKSNYELEEIVQKVKNVLAGKLI